MNKLSQHRNFFLKVSVFFLLLISFTLTTLRVNAAETSNALSLSLVETPYQTDKNALAIKVTPGESYTFSADISNTGTGDENLLVTVAPSTALSNGSTLVYSAKTDNLLDEAFDFTQYVTLSAKTLSADHQIELAPNETTTVSFTITIPKNSELTGELIGGINFGQVMGIQTQKDSVGIKTVYEKVISVKLDFGGDKAITDLTYNDFSFSATNESVSLRFNAYNRNPFLGNLNNALFTLKNPKRETIASGELPDKTMISAMARTPLTIALKDGSELLEGDYELTIETPRKKIVTPFTYKKEALKEFQKENQMNSSVIIQANSNTFLIVIISILALALVATGMYIYHNHKKREN